MKSVKGLLSPLDCEEDVTVTVETGLHTDRPKERESIAGGRAIFLGFSGRLRTGWRLMDRGGEWNQPEGQMA